MKNDTIDITVLKETLQRKALQVRDLLATVIGENIGDASTPLFKGDDISKVVAHCEFGGGVIYMKLRKGRLDISCTNRRHGTMVEDFMNHTTDKKVTSFMTKTFELLEIAQLVLDTEVDEPTARNRLVEYLKRLVT